MNNNFKRDTLISFFLVLVISSGFVFYFLKNREVPIKVENHDGTEISLEDKELKFQEEIKSKEKKVRISQKVPEKEITTAVCEGVEDKEIKAACLEYLNFNNYVGNGDVSMCDKLNTLNDVCIYKIAVDKRDFDYCSRIKQSDIRDVCFSAAALSMRDETYCAKSSNSDKESYCRDILLSSRVSDISQCALIKKPSYFANCVNNSKQDCQELEDETLVKNCQAWRLFSNIIDNGDGEYCDILPLDNFVKVCQNYFLDNKYLDSDNDKVNDWEELNFGTDPFSSDEDLREKLNVYLYENDIVERTLREFKKRIVELL